MLSFLYHYLKSYNIPVRDYYPISPMNKLRLRDIDSPYITSLTSSRTMTQTPFFMMEMPSSSSLPTMASLKWSPHSLQKGCPHLGPAREAAEAVRCEHPENRSLAHNPRLASFSPCPRREGRSQS